MLPMVRRLNFIFKSPAAIFLITGWANLAQAADLIVNVVNLDVTEGAMESALHDTPATFPRGRNRLAGISVPVTSNKARIVYKNLVPGRRYAVVVYHDENNNDQFDKGIFGIPLEGFGFSRDVSVLGGAPDFEECAFTMKEGKMEITITLKHSIFD